MEGSHGRSQSPRIGETGGPTVYVLSSAIVECGTSSRGAAADKGWSLLKASKRVCTFCCATWRRNVPWSVMLCMLEFTASNGEVVTETAEGHRVFATPPCKGQLRLAIVVAAETLPFVIGGSFCVKGRNCALDVLLGGKKFRVICSHLNLRV